MFTKCQGLVRQVSRENLGHPNKVTSLLLRNLAIIVEVAGLTRANALRMARPVQSAIGTIILRGCVRMAELLSGMKIGRKMPRIDKADIEHICVEGQNDSDPDLSSSVEKTSEVHSLYNVKQKVLPSSTYTCELLVNGIKLQMEIDTGASSTVVNKQVFDDLCKGDEELTLQPHTSPLHTYNIQERKYILLVQPPLLCSSITRLLPSHCWLCQVLGLAC